MRIYNTCLRILGNPMDAEEAMHDTFIKLFSNLDDLDDEQKFLAWSRRIAVNTAIDIIRKRKMQFEPLEKVSLVEEEMPDIEPNVLSVEKIKQSMKDLPSGYRIVLSMHLFEGFDFDEIAEILHVKAVSVRSQYSRGKQKLISLIQKQNEYGTS